MMSIFVQINFDQLWWLIESLQYFHINDIRKLPFRVKKRSSKDVGKTGANTVRQLPGDELEASAAGSSRTPQDAIVLDAILQAEDHIGDAKND